MTVKTRIPPSPTGYFHIGNARTALFNYLYAKKHGGQFVVRIEDTDKARSEEKYAEDIHKQLAWLGIVADETYVQSEHLARHQELLKELIEKDKAYVSKEPARDDPEREVEVVRLRNSGKEITFHDHIRGDITFDTTELGDFVIARSMDEPLYHLAVVIDDHDEGITHVIRGEDHISNTPRQILIHEALGFDIPEYAHLPLILAPDKAKLSKRKHSTSVKDFNEKGFLAPALRNFIAKLGWGDGTDRELFDMEDLVVHFDLSGVQKAGAVWNEDKLRWFNREYLLKEDAGVVHGQVHEFVKEALSDTYEREMVERLMPLILERIHVYRDAVDLFTSGEFDFMFGDPEPSRESLAWKKSTPEAAKEHLESLKSLLDTASESDFQDPEKVKGHIWEYAEEHGKGDVLWPLRFALTGKDKSPDPFTVASLLGKDVVLSRVTKGIEILS